MLLQGHIARIQGTIELLVVVAEDGRPSCLLVVRGHPILTSAAIATVLQNVVGNDVGDISLTSPTAPGVTRKWTRLQDYSHEVSAVARDSNHADGAAEVGGLGHPLLLRSGPGPVPGTPDHAG